MVATAQLKTYFIYERKGANSNLNFREGCLIPPSGMTVSMTSFDQRYETYLDSFLFHDRETLTFKDFLPILYLSEIINEKKVPISLRIPTEKYVNLRVINVLNKYYNEHLETITVLYKLYIKDLESRKQKEVK